MKVKFFCETCGKEMWQGLNDEAKETMTIADAEADKYCCDCLLNEYRKRWGVIWITKKR